MKHPYEGLDPSAFWRSGVADASSIDLKGIYRKKWTIEPDWQIATAGSCFAQHISRHLLMNGFNVINVEPAPRGLAHSEHKRFGFSMYSARTGNIYTVRQLLQLVREVAGEHQPAEIGWSKDGRFYDALRPGVEPEGLDSVEEVLNHRRMHLSRVREMLQRMDLFIFTFGLTEAWEHRESGTVFPTVPGSLAGSFDPEVYVFRNATYQEVLDDFRALQESIAAIRGDRPRPRYLLTVSPVPLTATATGQHVLQATTHSKAILRAVAGQLAADQALTDYFPSYEIVTNPASRSSLYETNLRSVRSEGVAKVMDLFFESHGHGAPVSAVQRASHTQALDADDPCEEALLEAFAP